MASGAKILLYTNHRCPWAHRAHIALEELGLPFEEKIIDLDTPRSAEYLAINPRGLVPTLSYNGTIIPESGIVAGFLTDAYPSHLVPPSNTEEGALKRAHIAFLVDAFFSKFQSQLFKLYSAKTAEEISPIVDAAVAALEKEVEPLLKNAGPFFEGSDKLTLAEVLTGPFLIRIIALSKAGVLPATLPDTLQEKTPHFWKWASEVAKHPSVSKIFDEEQIVESSKARIAKLKATPGA